MQKGFTSLLKNYIAAIPNKTRFSGLIKDSFPGRQKEINLILAAYGLGIAQEIEKAAQINNAFAYRFVKRMVDELGISRLNADWVVSLWCVCYGAKVLGKTCDVKLSNTKQGNQPMIIEEKPGSKQYGDLFSYARNTSGEGYMITGFQGDNWQTVIFPNRYQNHSVKAIKAGAFAESEIEEAIMTEGIEVIEDKTFQGCTRLRQIILPSSLKKMGDYALSGCEKLSGVTLPIMLEQIGSYALADTGIKTIQIPESIYWLGEGVFSGCGKLNDVQIPITIHDLPAKTFYHCESLTKIKLHEQLVQIGESAFEECKNLDSIYIPESVVSIDENAFAGVHERFIMSCEFGSFAEEYAKRNKLKYQLV